MPDKEADRVTQMALEIAEQPAALDRTLSSLLPRRAEIARLAGAGTGCC